MLSRVVVTADDDGSLGTSLPMVASANLRILVVDDDQSMVSTLRDILMATGHEVDVAYSGTEAIERAAELKPDCILMDIRMPGRNGVETFREIKRISPQSAVIFMTAYSSSALVKEARAEDAVAVLPKPLDLERLLRLIESTAERTAILVVDDDPAFCDSLADALAVRGCDVRRARSFDEALVIYRHEPRRALVLDMKLDHGHTGLEAIPLLRRLNPFGVFILITGFSELVDEMRTGFDLGVSACLTKPVEIEDLLVTIEREVSRRQPSC